MKVLVVGDTILDKYVKGKVERISPEAPVPVLQIEDRYTVLGGACNVAANIRTLSRDKDLKIDYFGFGSFKILEYFNEYLVNFIGTSVHSSELLVKTRYTTGNHHLLRVDDNAKYEESYILVSEKLIKGIPLEEYDLIVVSDYDKGTFSQEIAYQLFSTKVPVLIDLKKFRNWFGDLDLSSCIVKCNEKEYLENRVDTLEFYNINLVMTLGKDGYKVINRQNQRHFPAVKLSTPIADVVGAGDVFLAGMAAEFLNNGGNFDVEKMSKYGNKAASVKVKHFGTKTIRWEDVEV